VACKVTLAACVNSFHERPNSEQRKLLSNEIKRQLDKVQEPPPPVKAIKAIAITNCFWWGKSGWTTI
jgi:RNA processing factor Prp31